MKDKLGKINTIGKLLQVELSKGNSGSHNNFQGLTDKAHHTFDASFNPVDDVSSDEDNIDDQELKKVLV